MTGRRYAAKTPEQRRADRRARLMDAALEAFGMRGAAQVTIEQLCAAAGTSTRGFYQEFSGREELLIALHDDLNDRALQAVVAAIADLDPADVEARARAGVAAYFAVMTSDRRWARIALVETVGHSPAAELHRRAAIDRFAQLIELEANRLAELGLAPRRDYRLTAVALTGAINGLVSTWTADGSWDARVEGVIEEAARLIVLAVRGPA